jgi:hypothetical protein
VGDTPLLLLRQLNELDLVLDYLERMNLRDTNQGTGDCDRHAASLRIERHPGSAASGRDS